MPLFLIQGYNVKVIKRITMYYDRMTPIRHPLLFPSPDDEGLKTDNPGRANRKIIKVVARLSFLFPEELKKRPRWPHLLHLVEINNCPRCWMAVAVMQSIVLPCCHAAMLY